MKKQRLPLSPSTFTIEATSLEVISLNDIIRYGTLYLEQHPEIPRRDTVEAFLLR